MRTDETSDRSVAYLRGRGIPIQQFTTLRQSWSNKILLRLSRLLLHFLSVNVFQSVGDMLESGWSHICSSQFQCLPGQKLNDEPWCGFVSPHQTDRHRNHVHNFIQFISYNHANVPNFIPSGRANFRPLTNWPIEIKVSQQITLKRSELNCPRWRFWSIVPGWEDHWREIVDQVHSVFSCPNVSSLILFWFQFQSRALSQVHLNFSFLLSLDQEVERERWTSQRVLQGGSSRRRSWTRQTDRQTDRPDDNDRWQLC